MSPSSAPIEPLLTLAHFWGALQLVSLGLTLYAMWRWAAEAPAVRRPVQIAGTLAGLGLLAWGLLVSPLDLPTQLLTPLHEGLTEQNLAHVYGLGYHGGPAWTHTMRLFSPEATLLRTGVWLNLALWWLHLVAAGLAAWLVTRSPARTAVTVLLATLHLAVIHAAVSELPSLLAGLWYWVAAAGWAMSARGSGPSEQVRRLGIAMQGLAVVQILEVRAEIAGPALVGLALLAAKRWGAAAVERVRAWVSRLMAALEPRPLALLVAVTLLWELLFQGGTLLAPSALRWLLVAVDPFNPTVLSWPMALLMVGPLALSLLACLGVLGLWRAGPVPRGVMLGTMMVYKAYFNASHGVAYELIRYLTYLTVPLTWLVIAGWSVLDQCIAQLPERSRFAVRWAAALSLVAWLPHGNLERIDPSERAWMRLFTDIPQPFPLIGQDVQREVRFAQTLLDRHPTCAFVSRTGHHARSMEKAARWVIFGPTRVSEPGQVPPLPRVFDVGGETLSEVVARVPPFVPCVYYYRGLSCHLAIEPLCADDATGLSVEDEERFTSAPYNEPVEWGEITAEVRLSTFRLR